MAANKIILNGTVLIDLTSDTITKACVESGKTFHAISGAVETGELTSYDGTIIFLINFTIDGINYQAEENMTWAEWVATEYNTGGFNLNGPWGNYTQSATSGYYIALNDTCISNTETISDDTAYATKYQEYSSGGSND